MTRFIVLLLWTSVLHGCVESHKTTDEKSEINGLIRNLWRADTLTLFAQFNECGEWGGHTEVFKIYDRSNTDLWFDYKRDTVDCARDVYKSRKLIFNVSRKLTEDNQKKVIEYIHNMLDESFKEKYFGHAGQYYSVSNSDSTVMILNYVTKHDGFSRLRMELVK